MVTVVGKSNMYVHEIVCRTCSSKLEYTQMDIQQRQYSAMGDIGHISFITCPCCSKEVITKQT